MVGLLENIHLRKILDIHDKGSSKDYLLQTLPEEDWKGSPELLKVKITPVVVKESKKNKNHHLDPTQAHAFDLHDPKLLL